MAQSVSSTRSREAVSRAAFVLGVCVALLGLLVIYGWHTKNLLLIQVRPEFAPMQFNTALGFLLAGLGLCAIQFRFIWLGAVLGLVVFLLGSATLTEYLFSWDLGIDELLMRHYTDVKTSHPGRMAPNTAVGYVLAGVLLLSQGLSNLKGRLVIGISVTVSLTLLAFIALSGYLLGVESTYGWGQLTRMAVHTSVGFLLFGSAALLSLWSGHWGELLLGVVPVLSGLLIALCGLFFWSLLEAEQQLRARALLQSYAEKAETVFLEHSLQMRTAMERMADRLALMGPEEEVFWRRDAQRYLQDFHGITHLQVIPLGAGEPLWEVQKSDCRNCKVVTLDAERIEFLKELNRGKQIFYASRMEVRHLLPIRLQNTEVGALIATVDLAAVVQQVVARETGGLPYRILLDGVELAGQGEPSQMSMARTFQVSETVLELMIYASPEFVRKNVGSMPALLLLFSIILACLLGWNLWMVARQRSISETLNANNEQLVEEVRRREQLARELAGREKILEQTNAALVSSNQELEEFAYIASHDLKEPLRGIRIYAQVLLDDYAELIDKNGLKMLSAQQTLALRLRDLIDDLFRYSSVGQGEHAIREVDLEVVLEEVLETLRPVIEKRGVEVRRKGKLPCMFCDAVRIGEVFRNLIVSAMNYNDKPEKWVEIGYEQGAEWPFYVEDNGIGIAPEYHQRIFGMFRRLHQKDEFGGGTGAGLSIVRKIIQRCGGSIHLESEVGRGSRFSFSLGKFSPAA